MLVPLDLLVDEHEEEVSENGSPCAARVFISCPNLFTTGALFAGFLCHYCRHARVTSKCAYCYFGPAAWTGSTAVVARLTNTQSKFGAEYRQPSDMVSFGVAPALVMFSFALGDLGKIGWSAAFIYVACAALRLARFNTQIDTADKNFFTGLASPSAACLYR